MPHGRAVQPSESTKYQPNLFARKISRLRANGDCCGLGRADMMRTALVRMLDGISGGAAIAVTGSKGVEMKRTFLILMILAAAQTVSAQDWAKEKLLKSPRHSEWVTVKHDGRSVETFVVYPESRDKRPVVLIIHEIFGMSDW